VVTVYLTSRTRVVSSPGEREVPSQWLLFNEEGSLAKMTFFDDKPGSADVVALETTKCFGMASWSFLPAEEQSDYLDWNHQGTRLQAPTAKRKPKRVMACGTTISSQPRQLAVLPAS